MSCWRDGLTLGTPPEYQNTYALLLGYRDHHIPGKASSYRALQSLIDAVDRQNMFLSDADLPRKQILLAALTVNTFSFGFSIVEDFLRLAYALDLCQDLRELPTLALEYRQPKLLRKMAAALARGADDHIRRLLWYLRDEDLESLSIFSSEEKQFIIRLHRENISTSRILFESLLGLYSALSDANNKFKHGYPFLFGKTDSQPGLGSLGPWIPYLCDPENVTMTGAVPIGSASLRRLRTLIDGSGGLISMLQHVVTNSSFGCKIGGRHIVALQAFGPNALNSGFVQEGNRLSLRYLQNFGVTGVPEQLDLRIHSTIRRRDFENFLHIPE